MGSKYHSGIFGGGTDNKYVSRFNRELEELEEQGFVRQDKENGKWQACACVFSDFVFDGENAYVNVN